MVASNWDYIACGELLVDGSSSLLPPVGRSESAGSGRRRRGGGSGGQSTYLIELKAHQGFNKCTFTTCLMSNNNDSRRIKGLVEILNSNPVSCGRCEIFENQRSYLS